MVAGRVISWCLGLLLVGAVQVQAAPAELGTDIPVNLLSEADTALKLREVTSLPERAFQRMTGMEEVLLTAGSHWVRFTLTPEHLSMGSGWLELAPGRFDQLTLHMRTRPGDAWQSRPWSSASGGSRSSIMLPLNTLPGEGL